MAETSNGRVTITLGRSGQVVKRGATIPDSYSRSQPAVGSKRSVRDRLGGNIDSSTMRGSQSSSKRQRGDSSLMSLGGSEVEDVHIGKNDLRFKLQQKNVLRRAQSDDDKKGMDLRDKLSRTMRPPSPPVSFYDTRHRMPQPKETSILGRIPPIRSADDLHHMKSSRNSHSAWTLDHIRWRSPDRFVGTSRGLSPPRNVSRGMSPQRNVSRGMSPPRNISRGMSPPRNISRGVSPPRIVSRGLSPPRNVSRGLSPPRNFEGLQRKSLSRTFDDVRTIPYMSKDVLDTPRSVSSSTPFMSKPVLPPLSSKPVAPSLGQIPPRSAILQKPPFIGEEQQTVEGLLHSLGLGKYAITFKAEEVDMTALKQMGDNDLKELGIPMGPRKKILLAILPRLKRQQP